MDYVEHYICIKRKRARASGWCGQIATENGMSGLCSEKKEKDSRVSGDDKLVPRLRCITPSKKSDGRDQPPTAEPVPCNLEQSVGPEIRAIWI